MKFLYKQISLVIYLFILSINIACANLDSDAEIIFNWAESIYPEIFTPTTATQTIDEWRYRYYSDTDTYAGVNNAGDVAVVGDVFGGFVTVGVVNDFLAIIQGDFSNSQGTFTLSGPETSKIGTTLTVGDSHFINEEIYWSETFSQMQTILTVVGEESFITLTEPFKFFYYNEVEIIYPIINHSDKDNNFEMEVLIYAYGSVSVTLQVQKDGEQRAYMCVPEIVAKEIGYLGCKGTVELDNNSYVLTLDVVLEEIGNGYEKTGSFLRVNGSYMWSK